MKNLFLMMLVFLLGSLGTQAQKAKKNTSKLIVPEMVNTSFESNFAATTQKDWSKNYLGNYVANFKVEGVGKQTAEFNSNGNLLKSVTVYDSSATPEIVINAIEKDYAGAKINSSEKVIIENLAPYYKVNLTDAALKTKMVLVSETGLVTE